MRFRRRRSEPSRAPARGYPNVGSPTNHAVHRGRIDTRLAPDYTAAEVREMRWVEVPDDDAPEGIYYAESPVDRWGPWDG